MLNSAKRRNYEEIEEKFRYFIFLVFFKKIRGIFVALSKFSFRMMYRDTIDLGGK
jgi:hypothetical protein